VKEWERRRDRIGGRGGGDELSRSRCVEELELIEPLLFPESGVPCVDHPAIDPKQAGREEAEECHPSAFQPRPLKNDLICTIILEAAPSL
jgi:hypothetical protein